MGKKSTSTVIMKMTDLKDNIFGLFFSVDFFWLSHNMQK